MSQQNDAPAWMDKCTCLTCGYSWKRGQDGSHSCIEQLKECPSVGIAFDRSTLDEGAVRLEWPKELSPDSVEEFQDWIIGRINRARRKAGMGKIRVVELD